MNIIKFKIFLKRQLNRLAGLFSPIEKKVVFDSFIGRQYSDNPRAVSEKLHELYPDYAIIWGIRNLDGFDASKVPSYVVLSDMATFSFARHRSSAVAYVRNEAMTEDLIKRKNQLFIQTWHGDRGIKKILYDAWDEGKRPTKVMDEFYTDLFVVGSDYAENRIRTAFKYNGKVLKSGCPRNDCLINPIDEEKVRRAIGVFDNDKLVLYAPTLRSKTKVVNGALDIEETLKHLNIRGGKWVCLVRSHPKSLGVKVENNPSIIDVSKYPDMSDLLMISDMLITDYSSSAGDFILRRKPVILAQYDREQYMEEDRTFHVDLNETGYIIAKTQDEMNDIIDKMSDDDYVNNCEEVLEYFGTYETGHAAEDVCRAIDEHYRMIRG